DAECDRRLAPRSHGCRWLRGGREHALLGLSPGGLDPLRQFFEGSSACSVRELVTNADDEGHRPLNRLEHRDEGEPRIPGQSRIQRPTGGGCRRLALTCLPLPALNGIFLPSPSPRVMRCLRETTRDPTRLWPPLLGSQPAPSEPWGSGPFSGSIPPLRSSTSSSFRTLVGDLIGRIAGVPVDCCRPMACDRRRHFPLSRTSSSGADHG